MPDWSWPDSVVSRVVDCDSVDASLSRDIGFCGSVTFPVRLRLNRINGARASSAKGRLGKARVLQLTAGVHVDIVTMKSYKYGAPAGTAGEWMAEITLPGGTNLSDLLVAEGHAVYWDGLGARPADE